MIKSKTCPKCGADVTSTVALERQRCLGKGNCMPGGSHCPPPRSPELEELPKVGIQALIGRGTVHSVFRALRRHFNRRAAPIVDQEVYRAVRQQRSSWATRVVLRCAVSVVVVSVLVAAQNPPDVEMGYGEVERAFAGEHWKVAREKLLNLIAEHEKDSFLIAHSADLVGMMTECEFRRAYKVPRIDDFLAGSVKSFDRPTSKIKIRYVKGKKGDGVADALLGAADFDTDGNRLTFRVPFVGPHQVCVTGKIPSSGVVGRQPEIIVCQKEGARVRFTFTWPTTAGPGRVFGDWTLGSSFVSEDGTERRLEECNKLGIKFSLMHGKKYDLQVTVNNNLIVATLHGTEFLSVDRAGEEYGSLTLGGCPNVEEVVISGQIDPAWVDTKFEAHETAARKTFMESFDAAQVLPAWVCQVGG